MRSRGVGGDKTVHDIVSEDGNPIPSLDVSVLEIRAPGSITGDGAALCVSVEEIADLVEGQDDLMQWIRRYFGSHNTDHAAGVCVEDVRDMHVEGGGSADSVRTARTAQADVRSDGPAQGDGVRTEPDQPRKRRVKKVATLPAHDGGTHLHSGPEGSVASTSAHEALLRVPKKAKHSAAVAGDESIVKAVFAKHDMFKTTTALSVWAAIGVTDDTESVLLPAGCVGTALRYVAGSLKCRFPHGLPQRDCFVPKESLHCLVAHQHNTSPEVDAPFPSSWLRPEQVRHRSHVTVRQCRTVCCLPGHLLQCYGYYFPVTFSVWGCPSTLGWIPRQPCRVL